MFKEKQLIKFLITAVGLYLLWFGLYEFFLKPDGHLDQLVTENISIVINKMFQWTGYDTHFTQARKLGETNMYLSNDAFPFIRIGASCNGLELLVLFAIFIISYPGNKKHKFVFIILGLIGIHILNIFRNYWLSLFVLHKEMELFDLFHRYIFIFMVYGAIFLLWMLWVNKFSKLNEKKESENT
jgi:exosortase family protein XrtF